MKTKLMAMALLAGATMFAQPRVSVGIGIGGGARNYAPAYVTQSVRPPCPGPDYVWRDGYESYNGGRNSWVAGSWQRQAHYEQPRYEQPRYEQPRYEQRYRSDDAYRQSFNRDRDSHSEQNRNGDRGRTFGNGFRNR